MKEKNAIFIINFLRSIINVYFDTFFVFYFFNVANYEVVPVVKYYLTLYFFLGVGFFLIRNIMKKNIKVASYRLGIALQAIYIALIMLLKDNIINYIFLVGFVKGIAEGFFHFPNNLLSSEKIDNSERRKFDGILNTSYKVVAIVIPLILGVALTKFTYIELGKIFFMLFILMFLISFFVKDTEYKNEKSDLKGFIKLVKKDKNVKDTLYMIFFSGLTHSSGVMNLVITLYKIYNFKTNLNLGLVDSVCAIAGLLVCILYAKKIKKEHFEYILYIAGVSCLLVLVFFAFNPNMVSLIGYLLINSVFITIIGLIMSTIASNISNTKKIKEKYKTEYMLVKDIMFALSRCSGYLLLILVCLIFGKDSINYILIFSGISLFIECLVTSKLCKNL